MEINTNTHLWIRFYLEDFEREQLFYYSNNVIKKLTQ